MAHARVLVWWSFVVVWVALPHLQALQARVRQRAPAGPLTFARVLLVFAVVLIGLRVTTADLGLQPDKHVTDVTPWKVAEYLRAQYANDPSLKRCIFTSETEGDYLLWALRLDPPVRVSCYTHVHLFTEQHWKECMQVKFAEPGWDETLDRQGVQFLIVENARLYYPLMEAVRAAGDRWQVVFDSPLFVARRKPHSG
jgi:hypothetical protein